MLRFTILIIRLFIAVYVCTMCSTDISIQNNDDQTLTELISQQNIPKNSSLSFLHISDTHGSDYTLKYFVNILNKENYHFGIITGDIIITDIMQKLISESNKPIYMIPGNHDVYDYFSKNGQNLFRDSILNSSKWYRDMKFNNHKSNYYYVDIMVKGEIYRLICLDQYEIDIVGKSINQFIVMSQEQIDWFIKTLIDASSYTGIIIAMHSGFASSGKGLRNISNCNNFISVNAHKIDSYEYYGLGDPCMIPDIINAYTSGVNFHKVYYSGYGDQYLNVSTNFKYPNKNFIGYFGGHTHWDVVETLAYYPNQLQAIIRQANYAYSSCYDDIYQEPIGVNAITINACHIFSQLRKIKIIRLGAKKVIDGSYRSEISFQY